MQWVLHGAPISLFTRKLEAALLFQGVAFESRRVSAETRPALEARSGTHQIPVLETPHGWTIADSTPVMMWLDALFPARRLFGQGPQAVVVHVLEEVLDEWVSRVMVHYRWQYDVNTRHVIGALLGREVDVTSAREHPLARWGVRACRATGTETAGAQRAAENEYRDLITALESQLGATRFALGERPTAVDCALLGGLRGHVLNDPVPDMDDFPRVCAWARDATTWDGAGEPAPIPRLTPFAQHLLELAVRAYRPFVLANRAALAAGDKAFVIDTCGEPVSYLARPYPERSRQMIERRIADTLDADERDHVMAWLAAVGLGDCFVPDAPS